MSKQSPGDRVRWYAELKTWKLLRRNIMVEGDSDVRYFTVASKLYNQKFGKSLVGTDLSIFSSGAGSMGGTSGVFEEFPTLTKLIQADSDFQGKALFRVIALLDNDYAGKSLKKALLDQYRSMRINRDIFLLNRVLPRKASEPSVLTRHINEENVLWKDLDCEIEDLLAQNLIDAFLEEMPDALKKPCKEISNRRHSEYSDQAKSNLIRFVERNAILDDVEEIVEVLKSLRFYLGLDPDGAS